MCFNDAEHNPPHIHAKYDGKEAEFNIATGEKMVGSISPTAEYLTKQWIELHQSELLQIWETQEFIKIEPLK